MPYYYNPTHKGEIMKNDENKKRSNKKIFYWALITTLIIAIAIGTYIFLVR